MQTNASSTVYQVCNRIRRDIQISYVPNSCQTITLLLVQRFYRMNSEHYTSYTGLKTKLNSVAFSPQANYTDRATAACRRS
jgi:phage gp29-like protein